MAKDRVGTVVGRLTVIALAATTKSGKMIWRCRCECGNEVVRHWRNLSANARSSCGCWAREILLERNASRATPAKRSLAYQSYRSMVLRCADPEAPHYGAAGISVCNRWLHGDGTMTGLECFIADMGERPSRSYSIDRLNVHGNYEPKNCRWATDKQQIRNRTNTRFVVYQGDRMALGDACDKAGLSYGMVLQRLSHGETAEQALSRPSEARRLSLTAEQVAEIQASTEPTQRLAKRFKISRYSVTKIRNALCRHYGLMVKEAA